MGMTNLIGFILAVLILVSVHEFGHFIIARLFHVRVIRFAVGFGKPLFSKIGKSGTEYCLCAIPLGGYVKMLDSRELDSDIEEGDKPYAFDYKPAWQRTLIVLAGPAINLLLSVLLLSILSFGQSVEIKAVLGDVLEQSIAYNSGLRANDEVLRVGDSDVTTWSQLYLNIIDASLTQNNVNLQVKSFDGQTKQIDLSLSKAMTSPDFNWLAYGLVSWQPILIARISEVLYNQPAMLAGLKSQDLVTRFNEIPIDSWNQLVNLIRKSPAQIITLGIQRDGIDQNIQIKLGQRREDKRIGFLGAKVVIDKSLWEPVSRKVNNGLFDSLILGWNRTVTMTVLVLKSIGQLFTGQSFEQLGGPIAIAEQAGQSISLGWQSFLGFLSILSISLAILNLLPIPPLDGGHIVLFMSEMITRRKPSMQAQLFLQRIGIVFVCMLMVIAISNDISRVLM